MNSHRESVTKIAEERPRASKPHRCMICDQEIQTGEAHHRLVYRDNTALERHKALHAVRFHERCPPIDEPTGEVR